LLLSQVRIMSLEEKVDLVRNVITSILKKIEPGIVFDLAKTLRPSVTVYAWEVVDEVTGESAWVQRTGTNPVWTLFQREMKQRKSDYMNSLQVNDTLFNRPGREMATQNVHDTLFAPINSRTGPTGSSAQGA